MKRAREEVNLSLVLCWTSRRLASQVGLVLGARMKCCFDCGVRCCQDYAARLKRPCHEARAWHVTRNIRGWWRSSVRRVRSKRSTGKLALSDEKDYY